MRQSCCEGRRQEGNLALASRLSAGFLALSALQL